MWKKKKKRKRQIPICPKITRGITKIERFEQKVNLLSRREFRMCACFWSMAFLTSEFKFILCGVFV